MSLDITFQKEFTIEDVENKTSIAIEYKNNNWWMCKNNSVIMIKCYTQTEEDIERFKSDGFEIVEEDGKTYAVKDGDKGLIRFDKGKKNIVDGLTRYGMNELSEIMDELVLTFQTKFITDEKEEMFWRDNTLDVDKMYDDVTKKFGYIIENGIISK